MCKVYESGISTILSHCVTARVKNNISRFTIEYYCSYGKTVLKYIWRPSGIKGVRQKLGQIMKVNFFLYKSTTFLDLFQITLTFTSYYLNSYYCYNYVLILM